MELVMLGTGDACVTKCFNTCFALSNGNEYFLVDGGGGNGILNVLEANKISFLDIHDMFISHAHPDHLFGCLWVIRMIGQKICSGDYQGNLNIYCHKELCEVVLSICDMILMEKILKQFGNRIILHEINDGQELEILGKKVCFFDVLSKKKKQFGFIMEYEARKRLVFCGDEPLRRNVSVWNDGSNKEQIGVMNCQWLLHEAFCLYSERDVFKPYEKSHSTVREACEMAQQIHAENVILYHTEDSHIEERKELYSTEGQMFYFGNLLIPYDSERFIL